MPAAVVPQATPVATTPAPVPAPVQPEPTPVAAVPAPVAPAKPGMVKVDAFHETRQDPTDSSIWSAFNAKQSQSGPMEGTWIVASGDGRKLVSFELRNNSQSQRLEGAWRSLTNDVGLTRSGFISDLFLDGPALEVNYAAGKARTPNVLELRRDADGQWRGILLDPAGHKTAVTMSHAVHTG